MDGTLNADGYIALLEEHLEASFHEMGFEDHDRPLFQQVAQTFPFHFYPFTNFLLFQDGAPCHTAKKVMDWFAAKGINVIDWPAQSPDLNPIGEF